MRDDAPFQKTTAAHEMRGHSAGRTGQSTQTLRLLATTDLHMQLLGHDYVTDIQSGHAGLAGIATLIHAARAEADRLGFATLLVDNGDLLQGGPLADMLAKQPVDASHPTIAAFNHLRYDAIGLGNHDLDYGVHYLKEVAAHLDMPVIASNLCLETDAGLQSGAIVHAHTAPKDQHSTLKVGIVSVLPEHTAIWNAYALKGQGAIAPAISALRKKVPELRKAGADIVILLAHMGIRQDNTDSALSLAHHGGVDAMIAGHTHRRFPGDDHTASDDVDIRNGVLAGCPTVMPGHSGSDLAVLDLHLQQSRSGAWKILRHSSTLMPNTIETLASPAVVNLCKTAHRRVQKQLRAPVGHTDTGLHTYFSLAMPTRTGALLARAKAAAIRDVLDGTADAKLPLIAATAARNAGGMSGPAHYLHIPKGPILRRHLAGLAPYTDEIWGLRVTGTMIKHWLENAARVYRTLTYDHPNQLLVNADIPSFNFDTIYGIEYCIDPTKPIGSRIVQLTYNGLTIVPDQVFMLATNQFRAAGGGNFLATPYDGPIKRSDKRLERAIHDALSTPQNRFWTSQNPWRLTADAPLSVIFETAPSALEHLNDVSHLSPHPLGTSEKGFVKIKLQLK